MNGPGKPLLEGEKLLSQMILYRADERFIPLKGALWKMY